VKNLNNSFDGFIGGGNCNAAFTTTSGCYSYGAVVVGGVGNNTCGGTWSIASCCFTVAPTICNTGQYSFIGGGFQNRNGSQYGSILGGFCNYLPYGTCYNAIIGGCCNQMTSLVCNSFIGTGFANYISNSGYSLGMNAIVSGYNNSINTWSTYSGRNFIGAGCNNTISVSGSGDYSSNFGSNTIVAGAFNRICEVYTGDGFVGGASFIGSGNTNYIYGCCHSIVGGVQNSINNNYGSFIGGGQQNCIGGGYGSNFANFIGGGNSNLMSIGRNHVIAGGASNCISNSGFSIIGGGNGNIATGVNSAILGGRLNTASGCYGLVVGGVCQTTSGYRSGIVSGFKNLNTALDSFIGGGNCNALCNSTSPCLSYGAVVVGGVGNNTTGGTWSLASCCFSVAPTICNAGQYSFIGGGFQNRATACSSFVGGGRNNTAGGDGANSILGGCNNTTSAYNTTIVGGCGNIACCNRSIVLGDAITTDRICTTFVNNLSIKNIPTSSAGLPSGAVWKNGNVLNIV
jgi:hypothetical protein